VNESDDIEVRRFLKQSVPRADLELGRDLWPEMLQRMEKSERSVPWFDWVLLGAAALSLVCVPQMIPMLLYHL
jgi:hypothetical protein